MSSSPVPSRNSSTNGLKQSVLSSNETLAQSFALIAPIAAPLLTVPLVYASAGEGAWLVFLIATLTVLLVALNINQFARVSSSPGSLYSYIATSMPPVLAALAAWALLVAYFGTAIALAAGFQNYVSVLFESLLGFELSPLLLGIVVTGCAGFLAYRDVAVSARVMLVLQFASVAMVLCIAGSVLIKHGSHPDMAQLQLHNVSGKQIRMGLVLAIFCLVGFESATALGSEAKDPLRSIPRAVIWSGVLAGLFFCFCAYTEVLGFRDQHQALDKSVAPLKTLVRDAGLPPVLGFLIDFGAVISFFSCVLACLTAGARILFLMGEKRALPAWFGNAHSVYKTPHSAVIVSSLTVILPLAILTVCRFTAMEIYGLLGTLATFGFLVAYILVSIAAPLFLRRLGRLTTFDVGVSVVALIAMAMAFLGSVYPVPDPPYSILPYLFLAIVLAGTVWSLILTPTPVSVTEAEVASEN